MLSNLTGLSRLVYQSIKLRTRLYLSNQTPIIIYQMGKVGSNSILLSLEKLGIISLFHTHFLSKTIEKREYFDPRPLLLKRTKIERFRGEKNADFLYKNIILKKRPVKIITSTREPIGRNISAFFENFERETGQKYENSDLTPQKLTEIFLDFFPHSIPLQWFDKNIKTNLGIDVYEYTFPRELGYLSIHKDNVDLLILKSEIPDAVKEKSIADFLGIKEFKLINSNIGEKKSYSNTYKLFKQSLKLPASYIEEMRNSKYFNHFYSEAEIQKIIDKWR